MPRTLSRIAWFARIAWFVGLWLAGVAALGFVALLIKLAL